MTRRPAITVLPDAMRFVRSTRSISQESLATAVGCTPGMIALIETSRRQPSFDLLGRIAVALEVSPTTIALVETAEAVAS